jgi:hypothetical protein
MGREWSAVGEVRTPNVFSIAGYLGMVVFFGARLVAGDDDAPRWLRTTAILAMLVLTPIGWYIDWLTAAFGAFQTRGDRGVQVAR